MTSPIRFSAIHYIVGPSHQVQKKRDELTQAADRKPEPWACSFEFTTHGLGDSASFKAAAVVLTGKDAEGLTRTHQIKAYLAEHPKKDQDGQPVQYHQLYSRLFNPLLRLWYTFAPWIALDRQKKSVVLFNTFSKPA